ESIGVFGRADARWVGNGVASESGHLRWRDGAVATRGGKFGSCGVARAVPVQWAQKAERLVDPSPKRSSSAAARAHLRAWCRHHGLAGTPSHGFGIVGSCG